MYLLNPVTQNGDVTNTNRFTFHYVSIKSTDAEENHIHGNIFTFHYVSIKSDVGLTPNMHLKFIYIPLCIY